MYTLREPRAFEPGTAGWQLSDLDDPRVAAAWAAGRYEIVEGALIAMPAAWFMGGESLANLVAILRRHIRQAHPGGRVSIEVDLVLSETRVVRPDAVLMLPDDIERAESAAETAGHADWRQARLTVAPTLVIESISPGHELHDRQIKYRWYAEAGVANYWLLNAYDRSLECHVLAGDHYRLAARGQEQQTIVPPPFDDLCLELGELW